MVDVDSLWPLLSLTVTDRVVVNGNPTNLNSLPKCGPDTNYNLVPQSILSVQKPSTPLTQFRFLLRPFIFSPISTRHRPPNVTWFGSQSSRSPVLLGYLVFGLYVSPRSTFLFLVLWVRNTAEVKVFFYYTRRLTLFPVKFCWLDSYDCWGFRYESQMCKENLKSELRDFQSPSGLSWKDFNLSVRGRVSEV